MAMNEATATFELKLRDGSVVLWDGTSGEDAMRRYADTFRGSVVVAWRYPRHGVVVADLSRIAEPGEKHGRGV
jgi:hypothetical protein